MVPGDRPRGNINILLGHDVLLEDGIGIAQINNLLSSLKWNKKGQLLLLDFLPNCTKDEFTENCLNWMQWCCKFDACKIHDSNTCVSLSVFEELIKESAKYAELNKSVSHFLGTRFLGKFLKSVVHLEMGWKCIETCFTHYRGSCGAHQDVVRECLVSAVEKNVEMSLTTARVYALLPGVGEGGHNGNNYKTKWKEQFDVILCKCQSILHDLFKDVVDLQVQEDSYVKYCSADFADENHLYTLFHNYCSVLRSMLLSRFPVSKTVVPEKVFDLVCRCLNVSSKALEGRNTMRASRVAAILPRFQVVVHSLLAATVVTLKTHLLPYSLLVNKIIRQSLQATDAAACGKDISRLRLRIAAYDSLRNWLAVSKGGSCSESISKVFIPAVLEDVRPKDAPVTLKDAKTRKEALDQTSRFVAVSEELCYAALKALAIYLQETGCLLKPEEHKVLQLGLIRQVLDVQNEQSERTPPYSSSACRRELYAAFLALVDHACPTWPPPVQWALRLLSRGTEDEDLQVSAYCSSTLGSVAKAVNREICVPLTNACAEILTQN